MKRWAKIRYSAAIFGSAGVFLLVVVIMASRGLAENSPASVAEERWPGTATTRELNLAWGTKVFCSTVFVSKLPADAALKHSVYPIISIFPDSFREGEITQVEVDSKRKSVRLGLGEISRTATFYGDQGCVLESQHHDEFYFLPVDVTTTLPPADSVPWPDGEDVADATLPNGMDQSLLNKAAESAFHPDAWTAAFVVVHRGSIILERYGAGAHRDTMLASWSMGKSLTAALLGVLFEQGEFQDLNAPAPVPEWQDRGDPRQAIRIADLLRMSSGLEFSHVSDPRETWKRGHPDHMFVYSGAIDVFDFVLSRPSEFPPDTVGRYRNTDPLTLGSIIKRKVEGRGQNYFQFPQSDLFDRIGIRKLVLEPDLHGSFVMTGFEYGRARDWARLGMLYLQDGVWQGQRILPEGWSDFASTPAPAWKEPEYGGLFWLNKVGTWNLPEDAYYMAGGGGQYTIIVPSLDLVVVRMGHFKGGVSPEDEPGPPPAAVHLDDALSQLRIALEAGR